MELFSENELITVNFPLLLICSSSVCHLEKFQKAFHETATKAKLKRKVLHWWKAQSCFSHEGGNLIIEERKAGMDHRSENWIVENVWLYKGREKQKAEKLLLLNLWNEVHENYKYSINCEYA